MNRAVGAHQVERTVRSIYDGNNLFVASVTDRTLISIHAPAVAPAIESAPAKQPGNVSTQTLSPKWKTITIILVSSLNFCLLMSNICLMIVWPKVFSAEDDFEDARNLAIATIFFQSLLFVWMLLFVYCAPEENHKGVAIFAIFVMCLITVLNISAAAMGMQ